MKDVKWGALLMTILLMTAPVVSNAASAASEKAEVDSRIRQTEKSLEDGKAKQKDLADQVVEASRELEGIQNEINGLDTEIEGKKKEVEKAEEALEKRKEEIGMQDNALDIRLRTMYKSGDTGMLEVLMGSSDISDLLSNLDMIQKIYRNDVRLLKDLKFQYEQIVQEKDSLVTLQEELRQQQLEKKKNEEALSNKMHELEKLETDVKHDNQALESQLDQLNKESERLTEELRQQELSASSSSDSSYSGGSMLWPVPAYSRISSRYGYRFHPILHVNKMHTGIDISASSGENILAAADGMVLLSAVKGGYGNCVMIDHGGGIVTLYGHCSRLLVSKGQHVSRGDRIALVGSTGLSTGPHCHFEVRINGATTDPMNYLDLTGINVPAPSASASQPAASSQPPEPSASTLSPSPETASSSEPGPEDTGSSVPADDSGQSDRQEDDSTGGEENTGDQENNPDGL